eukprot:scaffold77566_cov63-Phaeocystis_antarctica.AAC.1
MVPWRVVAAQHVDLPTAHDGAVVARRVRQRRELQPLVATQERDAVVRDTLCVLPRHCDDKRLGVLRAAASYHEGGVADDGAPELARVGHGRVVHARRTCVHSAAASRGENEDVEVGGLGYSGVAKFDWQSLADEDLSQQVVGEALEVRAVRADLLGRARRLERQTCSAVVKGSRVR